MSIALQIQIILMNLNACMHAYVSETVNSVASSTQLVFPVLASQSDPGPLQHSLKSKQKQSASAAESSLESTVCTCMPARMHDKLYTIF